MRHIARALSSLALLLVAAVAAPAVARFSPDPPAPPAPPSPSAPGEPPLRFTPRSNEPPAPRPGKPDPAAPRADLRPRFVAGQSDTYTLSLDTSNTTAGGAAGETQADINQLITLRLSVVSADPERGSVIRLTHERLRINYSAHGLVANADTDKSAPTPPAPKNADALDRHVQSQLDAGLRELVGATLTVHLDAAGVITSIEDDGKLANASLPRSLGITLPTADRSSIAPLFGPVAIRDKNPIPTSVTTGQTWRTNSSISNLILGDIDVSTDFRVLAIRGDLASITFNTRMKPPSPGERTPASNAPRRPFKIDAFTATGTTTWDHRAGRLDSATAEINLAGGPDGNPDIPRINSRGLLKITRGATPPPPRR